MSLSRVAVGAAGGGRQQKGKAPGRLSVLKCGKVSAPAGPQGGGGGAALDRHIVAGSEASLVMKLEGFSPSR